MKKSFRENKIATHKLGVFICRAKPRPDRTVLIQSGPQSSDLVTSVFGSVSG